MSDTGSRPTHSLSPLVGPLHGILLAFPVALFSSALASDATYLNTFVVQWSHFSAWLLAGATLFGGIVLAWAIWQFFGLRRSNLRGRATIYVGALAIMWIAGLINCFQHSSDAWSSVGTLGLVLSIVSTMTALTAAWLGYSTIRHEVYRS